VPDTMLPAGGGRRGRPGWAVGWAVGWGVGGGVGEGGGVEGGPRCRQARRGGVTQGGAAHPVQVPPMPWARTTISSTNCSADSRSSGSAALAGRGWGGKRGVRGCREDLKRGDEEREGRGRPPRKPAGTTPGRGPHSLPLAAPLKARVALSPPPCPPLPPCCVSPAASRAVPTWVHQNDHVEVAPPPCRPAACPALCPALCPPGSTRMTMWKLPSPTWPSSGAVSPRAAHRACAATMHSVRREGGTHTSVVHPRQPAGIWVGGGGAGPGLGWAGWEVAAGQAGAKPRPGGRP
jgi:hypothetical protein